MVEELKNANGAPGGEKIKMTKVDQGERKVIQIYNIPNPSNLENTRIQT